MSKLDFLVKACVEEYLWSPEAAAQFVAEFERFMVIKRVKRDWNDTLITPAPIIDQVWRIAILHTAEYPVICGKNMIHYSLMLENDSKRYNETLETYESLFGEPANEKIWPRSIVWDSDGEAPAPKPTSTSPAAKKKRRSSVTSNINAKRKASSKKPQPERLQPVSIPIDQTQPVKSADLVQSLLDLDSKSRSLGDASVDSSMTITSTEISIATPIPQTSSHWSKCLQCGKECSDYDEFAIHNRDEHQLCFSLHFPDGYVDTWWKNSNLPCACPRCKRRFKSGHLLQYHCRTAYCYVSQSVESQD